ncbi:MAG TPA: hypothetical protein VGS19_32135 [Streptosporangiaceae bacterium]|nr:hypothetical protein [Streptosporangiaceae bacterium]
MPPDPSMSPPAVEPDDAAQADDAITAPEPGTVPAAAGPGEASEAEPQPDAETGAEGTGTAAPAASETQGRRGLVRPLALGVVAVLLGTFGAWATASARNLRDSAAAQNIALTDRAATEQVSHQVSAEVNTIFSYSYADTAKTKQAAQGILTGPAVQAYNRLFALVERNAPAERLIVTTKVVSSGVEFLTGGRARVLVFANQQDSLAGTHQTSYGGAMLAVTVVRADGRWKIENIDTFSSS